jgi:hypothetical protein
MRGRQLGVGGMGGGGERDYRTDKINKICFQFTIDYN